MVADPMARVRRAITRRARAEQEFRASLAAAYAAGVSYAALARELGVSRQAVRQLVEYHRN